MYRTENKLWEDVVAAVNQGLKRMGVPLYTAYQHGQPSNVANRCCILIDKLRTKRYGSQEFTFSADHPNANLMNEYVKWIDEITYQVSAYRPRDLEDDKDTITAFDAVAMLATYFNSHTGALECASRGLQPLRVTEIRSQPVVSDSTQYEFNPNFDLTLFAVGYDGNGQGVRFDLPKLEIVKMRHYDETGKIDVIDAHSFSKEGVKEAHDLI